MKIAGLEKTKIIKIDSLNIEVEAKYWRIGSISLNDYNKEISFTFNLFSSQDSTNFIESYCITELIGLEDESLFDKYFNSDVYPDIRTACYNFAIDNVEFFNGAIPISQ